MNHKIREILTRIENEMIKILNQHNQVIRTSKNLRGILDYARQFKNETGEATQLDQDGRILHVRFPDGAHCKTVFADATVLARWIDDRCKLKRYKMISDTLMDAEK